MPDMTPLVLYMASRLMQPAEEAEVQKASEPTIVDVEKAFPIAIEKAWTDSNGVTFIEGWISKAGKDLQKDNCDPEAFGADAMDEYFALGAPLTSAHQMQPTPEKGVFVRYPVGHIQKAATVKNGQILHEADHPTDAADFDHFPGSGNGVYGRARLTDPLASDQVAKGNVRGFSWTGSVEAEPLPGGRYDIKRVVHWRESTIAAFPINPGATIVAAQ